MGDGTDNIIRVTKADAGRAAQTLAKAFQEYPVSVYFMPDEKKRRKLNPKIYRLIVTGDLTSGEVYATSPKMEGVAVWQLMDKNRLQKRGFSFGWFWLGLFTDKETSKRQQAFLGYSSAVRARLMPERYWYLQMLGVDPDYQGKGFSSRLLKPMLARADREGLPVYLETQRDKNVTLYQHFGFKVGEEGNIPGSTLHSWAMVREPLK